MDALYIKQSTRPNLYKLTESELLNIINCYEPEWMNNKYTRDDMVAKIFKLWSEHILIDHNSNPIECLVCWDYLTNGNNMTFECGHKFHSSCIVKSLLIHSTETYINKINDKEINENFMIEYCCPQCKNCIDKIQFIK
jgi:hypothetical protein